MEIPRIPDTATETYLEHLEANITRQLKKADNAKVKAHLRGMLHEVQKRLQKFRQASQQRSGQSSPDTMDVLLLTDIVEEVREEPSGSEKDHEQALEQPVVEDSDVLVLTDIIEEMEEPPGADETLSARGEEIVKGRLKDILEKFQDRKHTSPEQPASLLITDILQEINHEAPLDTIDLSAQEQEKIKNRLKAILEAFQTQTQESTEQAFIETLTRVHREGPLDEVELPIGDQETVQFRQEEGVSKPKTVEEEFWSASPDEVFAKVCERVAQGESLALFKSVVLSEREQKLVAAFTAHLSSYKGLKKQQSFEMQHLTARSIHELDQIFKTYQIQGYLKAELTNVYNRLLNLRSRFSMLLN